MTGLDHPNPVILYSGGMDSHMLLRLTNARTAVHVRSGSRYEHAEVAAINNLKTNGALRDVNLITETRLRLSDLERSDAIIPNRNTYYALLASHHGDTIILAATAGDNSRDKDHTWAQALSALLTYAAQDAHNNTPTRRVTVALPAKHLTKRQLLRAYLDAGHDLTELTHTISCYNGTRCGNCKPCARRWAAFALNGYPNAERYEQHPASTPHWRELVERAKRGHRGAEDADTLAADALT